LKHVVLALLWIASCGLAVAGQDLENPAAPPGEPTRPSGAPSVPSYLEGIDLSQPAQEAFRDWPPQALRDRPYWLSWSWLSFKRAAVLGQPVMLVLTVPWSLPAQKFMKETLLDEPVLRVANESFVTVVVNSDRRPDVRERYRTGVLPAISLLLPEGMPMLSQANPSGKALPIWLGYVKPDGLLFALQEGRVYFDRWQAMLAGLAETYEARTRQEPPVPGTVRLETSDFMARWLLGNLDSEGGGFSPAPRSVLPGLAEYAAVRAARGLPATDEAARLTLAGLVRSPLHDRRDGGFHRMAGLPGWKGIQYEKLLQVQAEFLREAAMELRRNDSEEIRLAARDTIRFLTEVLARPEGGFFAAQVADIDSPDGGGWWNQERAEREPPPLDRSLFTAPNAAAAAALLRASVVLEDPQAASLGRSALRLVTQTGISRGRGALHAIDGIGADHRFLESQAQTSFALLDAFESTGDEALLTAAEDVAAFALRNLAVEGEVALRDFLSTGSEIGLLSSPRWPARHNVRLARTLLRLHALGRGDGEYLTRATEIIGAFPVDPSVDGSAGIELALAIEEAAREPLLITLDGPPDSEGTRALRRAALTSRVVWSLVRNGDPRAPSRARLSREGRSETVGSPEAVHATAEALVPAAASLETP
jgi:uncharacterized protein YyaL (SSP411 family)